MQKIRLIKYIIIILVFGACSVYKLKKTHRPNIRMEVDLVLNQLKSTNLSQILIDKDRRGMLDLSYSKEKVEKIYKILLDAQTGSLEGIWNYENLSSESERLGLIDEINEFRKAHLTILKYYDYETKRCNENTIMQKWTLKDDYDKTLIEKGILI